MGDFRVVKSLIGHAPEIEYATADEALEEGDLANFDSDNELEKVDDNDVAIDLVIVLQDAAADETNVPFIRLDPWVLIEGTAKGTVGQIGSMQSIDVTTDVITVETSTLPSTGRFKIRKVVDATAKTVQLTTLGHAGSS